jgi:hypothetical protein
MSAVLNYHTDVRRIKSCARIRPGVRLYTFGGLSEDLTNQMLHLSSEKNGLFILYGMRLISDLQGIRTRSLIR